MAKSGWCTGVGGEKGVSKAKHKQCPSLTCTCSCGHKGRPVKVTLTGGPFDGETARLRARHGKIKIGESIYTKFTNEEYIYTGGTE